MWQSESLEVCLRGKVAKVRTNTSSGDHECLLKILLPIFI